MVETLLPFLVVLAAKPAILASIHGNKENTSRKEGAFEDEWRRVL